MGDCARRERRPRRPGRRSLRSRREPGGAGPGRHRRRVPRADRRAELERRDRSRRSTWRLRPAGSGGRAVGPAPQRAVSMHGVDATHGDHFEQGRQRPSDGCLSPRRHAACRRTMWPNATADRPAPRRRVGDRHRPTTRSRPGMRSFRHRRVGGDRMTTQPDPGNDARIRRVAQTDAATTSNRRHRRANEVVSRWVRFGRRRVDSRAKGKTTTRS